MKNIASCPTGLLWTGLLWTGCLLASLSDLSAQDDPLPKPAPQPKPKPEATWPELSTKDASRAKLLLRRIQGKDEEKAAAAEADLVGLGAGVAPAVLRQLGNKTVTATDALCRVLDSVVGETHVPLLLKHATHDAEVVRRFVVGRLARAHDPRYAPDLGAALEDSSADVRFLAALGLGGLGDFRAMDVVFDECRADWRTRAEAVAAVLAPARGYDAASWVFDHMPRDDIDARITGLRLLRTLAPKDEAAALVVFLDADQHAVKKAAINALRVIVDGDPPLENLSVFQSIEMAKQWKARL